LKLSGKGAFNGHFWHLEAVYIYTKLLFRDEDMIFCDNMQNVYSIEIGNITSIVVKENEDGISSENGEGLKELVEACQ